MQVSDSETSVYPNTDLCLLLMFHTGYSNLAGVNKDAECTTCEIQTFNMTNLRCMQSNVDNDWNGMEISAPGGLGWSRASQTLIFSRRALKSFSSSSR